MFKARNSKRGLSASRLDATGVTDSQFLLCSKLDDLAMKIGVKGMNLASNDIALLKSEASFLEQQYTKSQENENTLIDIVNKVYTKLEKASNGNDADLRTINKTLRDIITQKALKN